MFLSGKAVQKHLSTQIDLFLDRGVKSELALLEPIQTFRHAHALIRSIEEFINIPQHELDVEDLNILASISIVELNIYWANLIDKMLLSRFGKNVTDRFKRMVLNSHKLLHHFALTNEDLGYRTILEASIFFQAHRRHLTNLLYVIPKYCRGKIKYQEPNVLLSLVHFSECYLRNVTSLHRQLVLSYIHKDYQARVVDNAIAGNYQLDFLEGMFTEPERVSIIDPIMRAAFEAVYPDFVPMPGNKVFSVSEMLNECALIGSYFSLFKHNDSVFDAIKTIIVDLVPVAKDDYFISISKKQFERTLSKFEVSVQALLRKLMTQESDDFITNSNSFHPLISQGNFYKTNVNLLLRFVYSYKNVSLNRSKQFQIKSGFLFEERVKSTLSEFGFKILEDSKRIQRQEFDVVAIRDNVIFNFQCKNNFVDITLIESNPKKFASKNKYWVTYYKKALEKEERREHLLKKKYRIQTIRHFVISRFPVISSDPSIILFKDLGRFSLLRH